MVSEHENGFESEFFVTGCKKVFEIGSKQFHDDDIGSILRSEPFHSGESDVIAHDFKYFVLIDKLRVFNFIIFLENEMRGTFLSASICPVV